MKGENKELLGEERSYQARSAADDVEFADESKSLEDEVEFKGTDVAGDDVEFAGELDRRDRKRRDRKRRDRVSEKDVGEPVDGADDIEAAQELARPVVAGTGVDQDRREEKAEDGRRENAGHGLGTVSIILSVLAFFLVPFLLGSAGIILGVISARRGSALGWWGAGIGAVAVILTAFIAPIAGF
ncbi:hypothetical protein GCM10011571_15650 [Marinithermofilum abyssi]|uniref:DUF4190 domain-containing protein n=1 Tax=Marinithermofilum abyssi TaxID=1571185 RepID=A0A8J2VHA4_9BACL|nr:ECF transporter S component [Marinithermofilum abyssi]GGE15001.1 hypothetical protein GCM10011571_15650 [Marinithermofilum abyssi]